MVQVPGPVRWTRIMVRVRVYVKVRLGRESLGGLSHGENDSIWMQVVHLTLIMVLLTYDTWARR